MIISFNARENHYKGEKVIDWYINLSPYEKSRKIIDIIYSHICDNEHSIEHDMKERFNGGRLL